MPISRILLAAAVALAALNAGGALAQVPRQPTAEPPPTGTTEIPPGPEETTPQPPPKMSPEAREIQFNRNLFGPDPDYADKPYDALAQLNVYGGKHRVNGPRPFEMFRDLYQEGPLGNGYNIIGGKDRFYPQLIIFGDWRTAVAYNDGGNKETGQIATRLNVDVDMKLTATERIHMFITPLQQGGKFTRKEFFGDDHNDSEFILNGNIRSLFFEGDAGQILSGLTDEYMTFDLPFTFGFVPLLFQNGVWMDDAIIGGAFTIPSRNSPALGISNMDVTFFAGGDRVTSAAIKNASDGKVADHGANLYGVATFVEVLQGYMEGGFGYTQDTRDGADFSYNNATLAFTRRYGNWLSNSVRAVWNFGQDPGGNRRQTADGFILLMENSLVTRHELTLVPYANFWVGFDKPQSLARDGAAGGILRNTGINFETDGLTGFPKLDDTGNDTYGGAIGLEYLFNLDQQLVVEAATVQVMGGNNVPGRPARGDQYALGIRYQIPISDRWIVRADAMHGWLHDQPDVSGVRLEVRRKF